jgi:hypothetical protein
MVAIGTAGGEWPEHNHAKPNLIAVLNNKKTF